MPVDNLKNIFSSLRADLVAEQDLSLSKRLVELEARSEQKFNGRDLNQDDELKLLLIYFVKEAVQTNDVKLCLFALIKLDPNNPIRLINLESMSSVETLKLVANYFQLVNQDRIQRETTTLSPSRITTEESDQTETPNYSNCFDQDMPSQLASLKEAKTNEIDENFKEALTLFELSGTRSANFLRVSIKHLMCASDEFLQKYCLNKPDLRLVWFDYLLQSGRVEDAAIFCDTINDEATSLSLKVIKLHDCDKLNGFLPEEIREFAREVKWNSARQIDLLISIRGQNDIECLIAELASHHLKHDNLECALIFSVSIGRAYLALDQYLAQSADEPIDLNLLNNYGNIYFENSHLLHYLSNAFCYNLATKREVIHDVCINLGLLGEFLQNFTGDSPTDELYLDRLIRSLESAIESGSVDNCELIDPNPKEATLNEIFRIMKRDGAREVGIKLVTIVILIINVFLMKLNSDEKSSADDQSISCLESIFKLLGAQLDEVILSASENLIRATNNLVIAVKSKLDALVDSEIIRSSFVRIVDKVAGLCLIDARYKSAAILYSQIEDNVNAVKALMRTGEADTVMNYALLVRDITVNRITINYIKHLRLEPTVIENFIRQNKL